MLDLFALAICSMGGSKIDCRYGDCQKVSNLYQLYGDNTSYIFAYIGVVCIYGISCLFVSQWLTLAAKQNDWLLANKEVVSERRIRLWDPFFIFQANIKSESERDESVTLVFTLFFTVCAIMFYMCFLSLIAYPAWPFFVPTLG